MDEASELDGSAYGDLGDAMGKRRLEEDTSGLHRRVKKLRIHRDPGSPEPFAAPEGAGFHPAGRKRNADAAEMEDFHGGLGGKRTGHRAAPPSWAAPSLNEVIKRATEGETLLGGSAAHPRDNESGVRINVDYPTVNRVLGQLHRERCVRHGARRSPRSCD